MTDISILKSAAAAALISCTLVISTAPAMAEGPSDDTRAAASKVKTHAGKGAARFDWLAARTAPAEERLVIAARAPGSGSWICSPAGFGSKSRCYKR